MKELTFNIFAVSEAVVFQDDCHILGNENSDLLLNFIFKLYQVAASATARPSYVKITTFLKR